MRSILRKASLIQSGLAASVLLLASGASLADSVVTLTAAPTSTTLPDGQMVPMWGYFCGAPVTMTNATCTAANGTAQTGASWQPPVIRVPSGGQLMINLTNALTFPAGPGANNIPTSLVITALTVMVHHPG